MHTVLSIPDLDERAREEQLLRRGFQLMLRAEGVATSTAKRYDLSVRTWQDFARGIQLAPVPTREQVLRFLAQRGETHAPNTVRNDHAALRRYFRFSLRKGS